MSRSNVVIAIAIVVTLLGALVAAEAIVQRHRRQQAPAPQPTGLSFQDMKKMNEDSDYLHFSIETLDYRVQILRDTHPAKPVDTWGETDAEQYQKDSAESLTLKVRYNLIAATYNAEMVRTNGRFTKKADIPEDTCCALPDRIRPYSDVQSPDAAVR